MTPCQASPGTIYLFAQESLPARYEATKTELIVCGLNTSFITQVAEAEELDGHATADARKEQGFHDKAAATLIRLLEAEVASGGLSGPRYVEHLAYALTVRLLVAKTPREDSFGFGSGSGRGLPVARLRRVLERMDADLATDLDLKTLAVESGYSRNHFLRMFLAATGFTPHQYLLRMRVKRAQALMKDPSKRLIDVALACGFSSQAHLSRVFREVVGAAPGEYRRDVL
jgi:AraC family transcriptional regulator